MCCCPPNMERICFLIVTLTSSTVSSENQIGDIFRPNDFLWSNYVSKGGGPQPNIESSIPFMENTLGYTEFDNYLCCSNVIQNRSYTTATVCASHCDNNPKCTGFQIQSRKCILLEQPCGASALKLIKSKFPVKYFIKESTCETTAECSVNGICFSSKGFSCACDYFGFCYPYPFDKEREFSSYHRYNGICRDNGLPTVLTQMSRKIPLLSISHCLEECTKDSKCTSIGVAGRFCHLNRYVCPLHDLNTGHDRVGYVTYIKDYFHNFTCNTTDDCLNSPHSYCNLKDLGNLAYPECECVSEVCTIPAFGLGAPAALFYQRLKAADSVRSVKPSADCFDLHICCPTLFPTPSACADADYAICPRSCGQCKSAGCGDKHHDCVGNKILCDDKTVGSQVKAQCPATCGTCGKSATDLGVSCKACKDDLPNCKDLADDGKCDSDQIIRPQCRVSCGCLSLN